MPVLGALSVTLEVPSVEEGVRFYTDAGLEAAVRGRASRVCAARGQDRDSIVLLGRRAAQAPASHRSARGRARRHGGQVSVEHGGRVTQAPTGFRVQWSLGGGSAWDADPPAGAFGGTRNWRRLRPTRSTAQAGSCEPAAPPCVRAPATRPVKPLRLGHHPRLLAGRAEERCLRHRGSRHGAGRPCAGRDRLLLRAAGQRPPRGGLRQVAGG